MAGSITITGLETFKDQSGDLTLVSPDSTDRPVNYWWVPRWWWNGDNTVYEGCVRLNNSSNSEQIYIACSENNPHLKVEWDGTNYTFDSDHSRKHVTRAFVTSDAALERGVDYDIPRDGSAVTPIESLRYEISNSGSSFTLKSSTTVKYTVDWGDGSAKQTSTSTTLSHTYSSSGSYIVRIYSSNYRPQFDDSNNGEAQIVLVNISSDPIFHSESGGQSLTAAWYGATSMTTFISRPEVFDNVTFLYRAWRDCSSLAAMPVINTSACTSFSQTWRQCSSLTSFPLIDTSSGQDFSDAWRGCSGLTSFPKLDFSSATTFKLCWNSCTSLTDFPANVFDTLGTLAADAFQFTFGNCALTAQSIENILTSLDTSGKTNITLTIAGGSNAGQSTWSAAANTALSNLTSKGWTIGYNS
jgi:hypothetical protein|tara:strand:+ start:4313 stop:5551 length:1239 start_codon:yes stop_codon:yes gene_type:complete